MDLPANPWRRAIVILCATALTAGAYFVSSGLHRVWWPVWIAAIPVLLLAPRLGGWQAFAVALIARALAALNFWSYLRQIFRYPLPLMLSIILVPAILFALAVVLYRMLVRKGRPWLAALAFPVAMVAGEYVFSLSRGPFLSSGYTQLGNLLVLQLATLTGVWGISFSVNLFPAGLSAMVSAAEKTRFRMAVALVGFYVCVLAYGAMRLLVTPRNSPSVVVGMVETHAGQDMFPHIPGTSMALMRKYAAQVQPLAARGAEFVVFPEKSALIHDADVTEVDTLFEKAARDAHVQVLLGILLVTDHGQLNEARLYSATGDIASIYSKHHLVPSWEDKITPGTDLSVLAQPAGRIGIEICYDLDFREPARSYGERATGVMLAPAWDQGVDVDADWHGHFALMRGVEDGFSLVRDAKDGLLTASDDRGRILAEEPTRSDGALVTLLAAVPVRHDATLYQNWGDWFAWLDMVALIALLGLTSEIARLWKS